MESFNPDNQEQRYSGEGLPIPEDMTPEEFEAAREKAKSLANSEGGQKFRMSNVDGSLEHINEQETE